LRILSSAKSFLSALCRSIILRVLVFLLVFIVCFYNYFLVPWLNRQISFLYQQQTGHELQHDPLAIHLFQCNLGLGHLNDSKKLWQADSVIIDIACKESLRERSLVINRISVDQLSANPLQSDNGQWNFADILHHQESVRHVKPTSTAHTKTPVVIKNINFTKAALTSNLLVLNNLSIKLAPVSIQLSNINLRDNTPFTFNLVATLNQTTSIALDGKVNLANLQGDVNISAKDVPFVWFSHLLKPYVAAEIVRGTIATQSHVSFANAQLQTIHTSGQLQDLKVRPTSMEQDAVKWKNLAWENAEIDLVQKSLHFPLVTLDELDGQFIVTKDRRTNIQAMILQPVQSDKPQVVSAEEKSTPWQFNLDQLIMNKAAIGFYDQSLTPSFTAIVQQFSGTIAHISSDQNILADIKFAGNVDGYAPVTLTGNAQFFAVKPKFDALFSFKQMDMGAFSPYSAEYAGWRIKKGLLSVDLNYHYEDGKILGKNHVVIDHLQFGEKVRSIHAVDLPLRLALTMLTDEKGIAVLDTEISGAPSDPAFNLREVIVRALSNTFKKIITAPFRFLSNLLSTKEDLGKVEFTAGESQLTDAAIAKLKLLAQAIQKRPTMRLNIHGLYDEHADLNALKEEQVKNTLHKLGLDLSALKNHDNTWAAAVTAQYKSKGLIGNALVDEQYQTLITQEIVDPERLNKLAHERMQSVKQYFVLNLGVASETILLDSDTRCDKSEKCSASEVVFTLEE